MSSSQIYYLTIPINPGLGGRELPLRELPLEEALDAVAKAKGFRNGKSYLKKVLGWTGAAVKNMTKAELSTHTSEWDVNIYETKDAYCYIRKLWAEKYAEAVNLIASEYKNIASPEQKEKLLQYMDNLSIKNPSYQEALCYRSMDGLDTIINDPKTANRVNKIEHAKDIAERILAAIKAKEIKI